MASKSPKKSEFRGRLPAHLVTLLAREAAQRFGGRNVVLTMRLVPKRARPSYQSKPQT